MSYNTGFTRRKSSYLHDLDCRTTGSVKTTLSPGETHTFAATVTLDEALEQGECISMVRVPRGFCVTDMLLTWTHSGVDGVIGVGDPFCCGRFLGPILMNASSGRHGIGADPSGTETCISMNRLGKIGRRGDGCGFGYTYTCETDIVLTLGYGVNTFQQGGGSVGGTAVSAGSAITWNVGVIPSGTVFGLKVEGYINPLITNQ